MDDIRAILDTANQFNDAHDITGCLLYYNNEFVQLLEGDKTEVLDLYENIKRDKRHSYVLLLGKGEKEKRLFDNWNMAFQDLNNESNAKSEMKEFTRNFEALSELSKTPTHVTELFFEVSKLILSYGLEAE